MLIRSICLLAEHDYQHSTATFGHREHLIQMGIVQISLLGKGRYHACY